MKYRGGGNTLPEEVHKDNGDKRRQAAHGVAVHNGLVNKKLHVRRLSMGRAQLRWSTRVAWHVSPPGFRLFHKRQGQEAFHERCKS